MRRTFLALALCSSIPLAACHSQLDDKPKAEVKDAKATPDTKTDTKTDAKADAPDAKAMAHASTALKLDKASSSVGFVGAKVTADHEGSFTDFDGSLTLGDDGTPTALEITVKVDSLQIEPPNLQEHLLGSDFFDAPTFPQSTFVSTAIREKAGEGGATHELEGNLTLHGKTKSVTFPAKVEVSDAMAKGTAEFKIDRTQWDIVYPGMKDDLIKDEVLLELNLSFPRG